MGRDTGRLRTEMKIICVDRNYGKHNEETEHPILFLKPETAITRSDWPFFVPDWSEQIEFETELVVRICKLGKSIPERFAHRYYEEVTLGIDFTARDIQQQLSQKGLPWEIAKGFDGSAYCGQQWIRKSELPGIQDLHFEAQLNGKTSQQGWTGDMLHTVDQIIAYASQYYLLKTGDLIFTGTPAGAGRVSEGDLITARLEGREVLTCRCK